MTKVTGFLPPIISKYYTLVWKENEKSPLKLTGKFEAYLRFFSAVSSTNIYHLKSSLEFQDIFPDSKHYWFEVHLKQTICKACHNAGSKHYWFEVHLKPVSNDGQPVISSKHYWFEVHLKLRYFCFNSNGCSKHYWFEVHLKRLFASKRSWLCSKHYWFEVHLKRFEELAEFDSVLNIIDLKYI